MRDIVNELLDDDFQDEHGVLNDHNEHEKLQGVPTRWEFDLVLEALQIGVTELVAIFEVIDKHLPVNFARKVDASANNDDTELVDILKTTQPVANAI